MPPQEQDLSSSTVPKSYQPPIQPSTPPAAPVPIQPVPATPPVAPAAPVTPPPVPPQMPSPPAPPLQQRSYKGIVIAVIILLLLGGVAYAYTSGIISLGGGGGPYTSLRLASNIFGGLGKIEKSSYALNLQVHSEPKDADAAPFTAAVPKNAAHEEAYKRDQDKVRDVNTILTAISQSYYTGKTYPRSLAGLSDAVQAASKNVTYAPALDSKDYTISVTFETNDAVDSFTALQKYYKEGITVAGKTVTMTKAGGSYASIPSTPKEPALVSIFNLQSYLSYVPSNLKLDGTLSGATQKGDGDKFNSKIHLDGVADMGDVNVGVDLEFRKISDDYYFVINKFPSYFIDLTKVKGKWIKLSSEEALAYGGGYLGLNVNGDATAKAKTDITDQAKLFLTIADQDQVLTYKGSPKKETVNGAELYRYELEFNKAKYPQFYQDLTTQFAQKYPDKPVIKFDQATLDYLKSPEFDAAFEYFRKNTTLTLWADGSGIPMQLRYGLRVVPEGKNGQGAADYQIRLALTLTLSDVNMTVAIDTPSPAMSIEDATILLTGQTKEDYEFKKQTSAVSSIQYALTSYKRLAGVYPASLDDLKKTQKEVSALNPVKKTDSDGYSITYLDDQPILKSIPVDTYTKKPFTYAKAGDDFALSYTITLPPYTKGTRPSGIYTNDYTARLSSGGYKLLMTAVNGKNTANSKHTSEEAYQQSQKDGDGDGLPDVLETYLGTNSSKKDTDGDGHTDSEELSSGTNPNGAGNLTGGSSYYGL